VPYVLTDISPRLRKGLSKTAKERNVSIQTVILETLYGHFRVKQPPRGRRRYVAWSDRYANRMVIRADPKLFDKLKKEAKKSKRTMKELILQALSEEVLGS
jgi:predicted HicB family RNase H-like nuclease